MPLFGRATADMHSDAVLSALQQRARDDQQQLWQEQQPRLFAIAKKILRSDSEAEILVSDALTDFMFHHVDQLQSGRAIGSYLRIMVVRRADRRRKQAGRHASIDLLSGQSDDGVNPEDKLQHKAYLSWLERCLQQLTQRARHMLKLHFGHDLSYTQIGEQQGVSKQAVGKAVLKAEKVLRDCIERRQDGGLDHE